MLGGDAAHVGRLLDLILVNDLLDVHLEAFAAAERVPISDEDDDETRVDKVIRLARSPGPGYPAFMV